MQSLPKTLSYTYLAVLILLAVLPLNGLNEKASDVHLLAIRGDYWIHSLLMIPLFPITFILAGKKGNKTIPLFIVLFLCLFFAFGLEFVQYFLMYRSYNVNDLVANGFGVVIGMVILLFSQKKIALL